MAAFAKKWGGRINEVLVKTGNWGQYYGTKLQIVAPGYCMFFKKDTFNRVIRKCNHSLAVEKYANKSLSENS